MKVRSRKKGIFFPIPKKFKQRSGVIIHSVQKDVLYSRVEDISCDGQTEGKMYVLSVHKIDNEGSNETIGSKNKEEGEL